MAEFDLLGDPIVEHEEKIGRPRHEPEDRERAMVEALSGYGVPQTEIAAIVRIDPTTLRERYREELDRGQAVANAKVAQNLFTRATGPSREAVTAAMFWLRCRAGWSEFAPANRPERGEPMGKKDARELAAETAEQGTGWSGLLN